MNVSDDTLLLSKWRSHIQDGFDKRNLCLTDCLLHWHWRIKILWLVLEIFGKSDVRFPGANVLNSCIAKIQNLQINSKIGDQFGATLSSQIWSDLWVLISIFDGC